MTETTYDGEYYESNEVWHPGRGSYYYYGYLYSGSAPSSHIPGGSAPSAPSSYGSITVAGIPLNYNGNPNFNNYTYVDPQAILDEKYPKPPEPEIPEPAEPPAIIATANPPVANNSQSSSNWLDYLQEGIGWLGLAPGVGAVPDLVNAGIYTLRGNYKEAAISGFFALPIIGDAASAGRKVTKAADKAGDLIKNGRKADEALDLIKGIANNKTVSNEATEIAKQKPLQNHHFATNKHSFYKDRMQEVIDKYGLKLEEDWNKEILPHLGRHTEAYHDEVLRRLQRAAQEAGNDKEKFLELYEEYVKKWVRQNPEVMQMKRSQ
jgi:hypothetical protein